MDTELAAAQIALDSMVAYSEAAQPGPETTNVIFQHRTLWRAAPSRRSTSPWA